ncbi:MAG TPA: nucleotide exchange factor GrpE [Amycolatopsis sp.]|uniref:nucleotide exchange factor GrpE n=1 Tax=Amycolatopsis sp. TaxID=37632 RepID=UPI002B46E49C|nr:nucleotide exchange factor GrpE [Amycolatopsis sp.]HKS49841.1 nucleotide exchange factor GrpE [Amycolatopsis sp.]
METPAAGPERLLLHELIRLDLDTEALVEGITDLLDTLGRPLDDGVDTADHTVLRKTAAQLETVLSAHSAVELIGRRGELAAPETHHVVETNETTDMPANTVVKVIERGIRYRGNLLRPASVIISSGKGTQS